MADTTSPTVALLGTGVMGAPMARNLSAAGLKVRAWNRSRQRAEPLTADGVQVTDTAAEAVAGADLVVTMLFDLDAVRSVADVVVDAFADDAVWLQMSTVGVAGSRSLAALAAENGIAFVDAPVVGTRGPAEQGRLVVLASGPEQVRDRCAPVFDAVGARTVWVDEGLGASALKLVVNNWVLALIEGLAESMALASSNGLDPQLFLDTIKGGPTDCAYAHIKGAAILGQDFTTSFSLSGARKDAGLVLDLAAESGLDLALTEAAHRHLRLAEERGHGDEDMAAAWFAHVDGD